MSDINEFLQNYNINLTKQQRSAVEAVDGPTLLLAVPGSGKTTTLVARLGYMIYEKNIAPEDILVLTYTVAATKDMSRRFVKVFGNEFEDRLEFRTINGVCAKIILYASKVSGREAFQLEADEKDRARRISFIYQRLMNDYPTEGEIRDISTAFTYIKNMMLTDEEIKKFSASSELDIESLYRKYNESLQNEGKMDYDDQMRYAYNILKSSNDILKHFQKIYKYICVDEAQDTSKIQHAIIALLASRNENLFMVGDEDQSIYGFRAAYPQALLDFEKNHENAKVLVMEENFRSNAKIVDAADSFIQKNLFRHKKSMFAHRESGTEIKLKELPTRPAQYEYLAKKLEKCTDETAVLYKNNDSVIPLVDRLDRMNIPFSIKNAELLFFTNRVVTDVMNIYKFALNPYDAELFMKIYYKMNIYLSKKEAQFVCQNSARNGKSILKTLTCTNFDNAFKKSAVCDFASDMNYVASKGKPLYAINHIVNMTGYKNYLEKNHLGDGKIYILKEVAKFCSDYKELVDRLNELYSLLKYNKHTGKNIILSTIHSSKGLEYKTVYMLDIVDGIIPEKIPDINASKEERNNYEEERRIYYVGITRAKDNLVLLDTGEDSAFIGETVRNFKPDLVSVDLFGKNKSVRKTENSLKDISYTDYCKKLKKGVFIKHSKFGKGVIINVEIPYITIEFASFTKTFGIKFLYEKNLIKFL